MFVQSWESNWNEIFREIIFQDAELKTLMKIPDGTNIITFRDKYFIHAGDATSVLTDEPVRIIYGSVTTGSTGAPNVKSKELSFDIYVKQPELYNAGRDRLVRRTTLIANRLASLLTQRRYIHGYRFWIENDEDMTTRTIGYARRNISFGYMQVY